MKDESIFVALFLVTVLASLHWTPGGQPLTVDSNVATSRPDACHDPRLDAEWQTIRNHEPVDPLILRDHALRVGLCQMLEQGEISSQQLAEAYIEPNVRPVSGSPF